MLGQSKHGFCRRASAGVKNRAMEQADPSPAAAVAFSRSMLRNGPLGRPQQLSFSAGQKWGRPRKYRARRNPLRPAGWETCDTADLEICATIRRRSLWSATGGRKPALVAQASKLAVSPTSKSAGVRHTGGFRTKSNPHVGNSFGHLRYGGMPAPPQNENSRVDTITP